MTTTTKPAAPVAAAPARRVGPVALGLRQGRLEITQFLRSRESVVFTMGFPVIMILIFAAIFRDEIAPGVSYTQYFITGMIATGLMTVSFQNLGIWIPIERDRGVLKRYRGTPMPKWVYFAGKVLMVVAIGIAETALLLAVSVAFFDLDLPGLVGWLTFGWVAALGVTACTLCGIAISSLARTARSGSAVVTPVALVLQFISGVFFVFTELPSWMQQVAALFPLKWMCQGLRSVFLPESFGGQEPGGSFELGRVALVLGAWCVIGLVLCLTTFRWTTRRDG
ncbi:ABC transporter permease [Micromonospora sp. WMMD812]|uniref:ABC transporter permease n=1 Tax=Micromonospora sp. WMMD812 TaxID=3015152 RepID=UPI00248AF69F|nr:ABC transporter permease [Micromonospora sp. WMMD812]WBB66727.1 ABC transporter permease [Micromonospora sp. WMMD812]